MSQSIGNRFREATFRWAGRLGACDTRDTIVIAGSPRSGTTFLLETLHKLDSFKALNEPLQVRYAGNHGFNHRTFLAPSEPAPVQRAYLQKVCTGQLGLTAPWLFNSPTHLGRHVDQYTRSKLVVKFCRLNRMLHWFASSFEVRGIVLVVRHPCATVSSMLKHGAWKRALERKTVSGYPLDISGLPAVVQERFRPIISRIDTLDEALATIWCLDNYIPFVHFNTYPWILVPYERLVRYGVEELHRIADALRVDVNDEMLMALSRPSISAKGSLAKDPEVQVSKWKGHLTARQEERIMRIVDAAELSSFYIDEGAPNFARLNELQDQRWRWHL